MTKRRKETLLDFIAERSRAEYISDLHTLRDASVMNAIAVASTETFPVYEWNVAIRYMFRIDADCRSPAEAKQFMLSALEG